MSQVKFAPMTSSLLARKGGAMPSVLHAWRSMAPPEAGIVVTDLPLASFRDEPALPQTIQTYVEAHQAPAHRVHTPAHDKHDAHDGRTKKLFVPMSHAEHERLAIASVKSGLSRHQLVRDALEMYFAQLSADLGDDCPCVTDGFGCRGNGESR
jgi:hypothetical protein